jgi:hypothetical protein
MADDVGVGVARREERGEKRMPPSCAEPGEGRSLLSGGGALDDVMLVLGSRSARFRVVNAHPV